MVPGKTNTEIIRETADTVATLVERVNNIRRDIDRIDGAQTKTVESVTKAATQLTVLEEKFVELKRVLDERDRRRWSIWLAVIASFLTLLVNVILLFVRK